MCGQVSLKRRLRCRAVMSSQQWTFRESMSPRFAFVLAHSWLDTYRLQCHTWQLWWVELKVTVTLRGEKECETKRNARTMNHLWRNSVSDVHKLPSWVNWLFCMRREMFRKGRQTSTQKSEMIQHWSINQAGETLHVAYLSSFLFLCHHRRVTESKQQLELFRRSLSRSIKYWNRMLMLTTSTNRLISSAQVVIASLHAIISIARAENFNKLSTNLLIRSEVLRTHS